jgi:phenylpropionate dioxygenase-like ring-hydroxylating dioxygenase large terminal subunit
MKFTDFWYVVEESENLRPGQVLARKVLGEWIAVFRDENGKAVALRDRCLHRSAQLSRGWVKGGKLTCSYHGWTYDGTGKVCNIPSLGPEQAKLGNRCSPVFSTREQDGFVYVRPTHKPEVEVEPFTMPHYGDPGYKTLRLVNRFENNVTNCAENFVDVPHTAFVHKGIFRSSKDQAIRTVVERKDGTVIVTYHGESSNIGIFARILNPKQTRFEHIDRFYMPNVTSVEYRFALGHFFITSQSVPVTDEETLVYTDLTYNYGALNEVAAPIVRRYGQKIIDQDIEILKNQMDTIRRYPDAFANSPADIIHVFIESIRNEIAAGRDPRALPPREEEISFWV